MDTRAIRMMMPRAVPNDIIVTIRMNAATARNSAFMTSAIMKFTDILNRTGLRPFTANKFKLVYEAFHHGISALYPPLRVLQSISDYGKF